MSFEDRESKLLSVFMAIAVSVIVSFVVVPLTKNVFGAKTLLSVTLILLTVLPILGILFIVLITLLKSRET